MKEDSVYLSHILESIDFILHDTKGLTEEEFLSNRPVRQIVERNVEIIGEAVKMISEKIRSENPDVPWQKIARTRDMLIHHYFNVDDQQLWKIIVDDLTPLRNAIKKILDNK